MLYFGRIEVSEGTDDNKRSESKECNICHYCYFLNKSFKFQSNICNRCHDLLMMSMNFNGTAILNIKGAKYCGITSGILKNEAIDLTQNVFLMEKKVFIIKHFQIFKYYHIKKWIKKF